MNTKMSGERPSEGSMPNKRLKKRSEVWEHFDETPDGQRAICKYCAKSLNGNSKDGTSHLKRHLKSCKKRPQGGVCPPPTLVIRNEAINMGLIWDKTREDLVKKAIKEEIPFASSECRKLWHNLVGPMDVEKEIFTYYERAKEKLAIELEDLTSRVSFSFEVLEEVGYMSITAYFIDKDFNLMRKLISLKKLSDVHSSACKVDAIKSCISEWKLGDKIFTFIRGKSFNMWESMLENFSSKMLLNGKFMGLVCCKDVMTRIYSVCFAPICYDIEKFVEALIVVPSRLAAFNVIAGEKGLSPVNIDWLNEYRGCCQDWDNEDLEHWNLAAKIFKEVIIYKDVFRGYVEIEGSPTLEHEGDSESDNLGPNQLGNANSSSMDTCTEAGSPSSSELNLCTIDWNDVELALKFSDLCSAITDGLSSYNHPTLSLCFQYIAELDKLMPGLDRRSLYIVEYFKNYLFVIANALDPRYKLIFSKYYWTKIKSFPNWGLDEHIKKLFCAYEKEEIKEASLVCIEHTNREHRGSSSKSAILSCETIDEFSMYVREIKNTKKSELDKYLDDELVDLDDANFNLLGWWKENRLQYPILSKMARDILAVPASVFSTRGIISSDFEAFEGLNPELVEAVVCSKDWILSDEQRYISSDSWEGSPDRSPS